MRQNLSYHQWSTDFFSIQPSLAGAYAHHSRRLVRRNGNFFDLELLLESIGADNQPDGSMVLVILMHAQRLAKHAE
jgi:hypothetical protein